MAVLLWLHRPTRPIGIVAVAAFAASGETPPPVAAITATSSATFGCQRRQLIVSQQRPPIDSRFPLSARVSMMEPAKIGCATTSPNRPTSNEGGTFSGPRGPFRDVFIRAKFQAHGQTGSF